MSAAFRNAPWSDSLPGSIPTAARRAPIIRGSPQATWKRRTKRLSIDESEKTERLARVLAAAEYVWDDRDQARESIAKPHRELDGKTPLEAARTKL